MDKQALMSRVRNTSSPEQIRRFLPESWNEGRWQVSWLSSVGLAFPFRQAEQWR
jgi:hypothetical protein